MKYKISSKTQNSLTVPIFFNYIDQKNLENIENKYLVPSFWALSQSMIYRFHSFFTFYIFNITIVFIFLVLTCLVCLKEIVEARFFYGFFAAVSNYLSLGFLLLYK